MNPTILNTKLEIIKCVHQAYLSGLQVGTGGNFSSRLPGTKNIVIKPKGYSFIECSVENLVVVDSQGNQIEGFNEPSTEIDTHLRIYRMREDIGSIMHCHSPLIIAYAELYKEITSITYHFEKKIGKVPILNTYDKPIISEGQLNQLFNDYPNMLAFIHSKHGIFSFGTDLLKARFISELVLENLQTTYFLDQLKKSLIGDASNGGIT